MIRGRGRVGRWRSPNPIGDKPGSGPGGYCVCPHCGFATPHNRARPCNTIRCPKCGTIMTKREE
jgi:hypothetical protein